MTLCPTDFPAQFRILTPSKSPEFSSHARDFLGDVFRQIFTDPADSVPNVMTQLHTHCDVTQESANGIIGAD